MYSIYVVFKSLPQKREEYIKILYEEGIVDEIRKEDGCIKYDFYFSEKDPDEILLIEYWETKEKQQVHTCLLFRVLVCWQELQILFRYLI